MAVVKNADPNSRLVAENRKARFNYEVLETFETGIALKGTEVKSLREGRANVAEAYAADHNGELYLYNAYVPEYQQARRSAPISSGGGVLPKLVATNGVSPFPGSKTAMFRPCSVALRGNKMHEAQPQGRAS
jgi:hypothetical protein